LSHLGTVGRDPNEGVGLRADERVAEEASMLCGMKLRRFSGFPTIPFFH
jgi:hypothetical protein